MTKQWQPGKDMELLLWETAEERTEYTAVGRITWGNGEAAEMSRGIYHNFAGNLASSSV